MKILFNTYPMAFHTPGGGEIQLMAYLNSLKDLGIEVDLFDTWNPNFLKYDLVHYFSCIAGSSHFCNFVKQLGLPLVVSSSLWITEETKHLYPYEEIRRQLNLADSVVTNSNLECNSLSDVFGIPRDKFNTVYNGVDPVFFDRIEPSIFRNAFQISDKFVLNVGNIEPRKNQLNLVKAMKMFPNETLVLIGHVRDENYASEVFKLGGEQIKYISPIDHLDPLLRSAYAACDLFCLPSTLETPGLAALEASCVTNKIAITQEGSTKEYFGSDAIYLDPYSVDSICLAIQQAKHKDLQFSADAVRAFPWKSTAKNLVDVYEFLFNKHNDTGPKIR
jgi:glycosyltransferase involved in cell wall biosynthesis